MHYGKKACKELKLPYCFSFRREFDFAVRWENHSENMHSNLAVSEAAEDGQELGPRKEQFL